MLLFQLLFLLTVGVGAAGDGTGDGYAAIFSFGASYSDTGNFLAISDRYSEKMRHLPYGETFFGRPSGRTSDGRLILDFIAEGVGLPFVPPFKNPGGGGGTGANFAVVGATALALEYYTARNVTTLFPIQSSLAVQLSWFDSFRASLCAAEGADACAALFRRSLFIVGEFGFNDYNAVLDTGWSLEQAAALVPAVVGEVVRAVEHLASQGAATILVPGVFPIGCLPKMLSYFSGAGDSSQYDPNTGCLAKLNALAAHHNAELQAALELLRIRRIIYADLFNPIIEFVNQPKQFGFVGEPLRACCGGGAGKYNFDLGAECGSPGVMACPSPSVYVNWDGYHLTEAAHRLIARRWLRTLAAAGDILVESPASWFANGDGLAGAVQGTNKVNTCVAGRKDE